MKRIASFSVDHDLLTEGIYVSRIDGDAVTYDLRMKKPNNPEGDYISPKALHTIEHLFATFVRNSPYSDSIIYAGPMGCRTGFYLVVRDSVSGDEIIKLVQDAFRFTADFEGEIPGSARKECGNYLEHDLEDAKKQAAAYCEKIAGLTAADMQYKK